MGFLELDETPVKDDNIFQRLFWPSADNPGDADALGQGGFWICIAFGVVAEITLMFAGHPLVGFFTLLVYALAGSGVREHSTAAAALLASISLLNCIAGLIAGNPPGAITIITTLVFLANVRSTWIAARWAKTGDSNLIPERQSSNFFDVLCDQIPPRVWPIGKYFFFVIAGIWLLVSVLGVVALALHLPLQHPAQQTDGPQQIEVTPTR